MNDVNNRILISRTKNKQSVFLDTKYWLYVRDTLHGKRQDNKDIFDLTHKLIDLVKDSKIYCPINASVFYELCKQSDLDTRKKSASIMDELSCGVVLKPFFEIIKNEIVNDFHHKLGKVIEKPINLTFPKYINGVINANYFDKEYTSLETLSLKFPYNNSKTLENCAKRIHETSRANNHQVNSFDEAINVEYIGTISEYLNDIAPMFEGVNFENIISLDCKSKISKSEQKTKLSKSTPYTYARAILFALYRHDKDKILNDHDILDIDIASAALSQCDYFFTEDSLCDSLNKKTVKNISEYKCNVYSKPSDVNVVLSQLQQQQ